MDFLSVLGGKTDLQTGTFANGQFFKPNVAQKKSGILEAPDFVKKLDEFFGTTPDDLLGSDDAEIFRGVTGEKPDAIKSVTGSVDIENIFSRIAIVVLGLIFVAIGLSLFGSKTAIKIAKGVIK